MNLNCLNASCTVSVNCLESSGLFENKVLNLGKKKEQKVSYRNEISKFSLIDREEEIRLAKLIQEGDEDAREALICANLRLVVYVAQGFKGHALPLDDLIAEGNIGLMKAADKFDPINFDTKFSGYAYWWIKQRMRNAVALSGGLMKVPTKSYERIRKVIAITNRMKDEGIDIDANVVAEEADLPVVAVKKLLEAGPKILSLDHICDNNTGNTGRLGHEITPQEDNFFDAIDDDRKEFMYKCIDELPSKTANIIMDVYGIRGHKKKMLREVAEELGISHQRVQQISAEGLKRIRMRFTEEAGGNSFF